MDQPNPEIYIVWDAENATVDSRISVFDAVMNVKNGLRARLPELSIKCFTAFGNVRPFSDLQRKAFCDSRAQLIDIIGGQNAADMSIMLEMFRIAFDSRPPAYIMLISSDGDFIQALNALKGIGFTMISCHQEYQCKNDLRLASDIVCDWYNLYSGQRFMFKGEIIDLKLKPALPSAPRVPLESKSGAFWNLYSFPLNGDSEHAQAIRFMYRLPQSGGVMTQFKMYGDDTNRVKNGNVGFDVEYIETTPKISQDKKNNINNVMLVDIMKFAYEYRQHNCNIIIATADEDLIEVIQFLRDRNFNVTVIIPSVTRNWELRFLRASATSVVKWRYM